MEKFGQFFCQKCGGNMKHVYEFTDTEALIILAAVNFLQGEFEERDYIEDAEICKIIREKMIDVAKKQLH